MTSLHKDAANLSHSMVYACLSALQFIKKQLSGCRGEVAVHWKQTFNFLLLVFSSEKSIFDGFFLDTFIFWSKFEQERSWICIFLVFLICLAKKFKLSQNDQHGSVYVREVFQFFWTLLFFAQNLTKKGHEYVFSLYFLICSTKKFEIFPEWSAW